MTVDYLNAGDLVVRSYFDPDYMKLSLYDIIKVIKVSGKNDNFDETVVHYKWVDGHSAYHDPWDEFSKSFRLLTDKELKLIKLMMIK